MNDSTKVTLSDGELAIAMQKDFILTKRIVIEKAATLFNNLIKPIGLIMEQSISNAPFVKSSVPKISKGENYQNLPYVLLDYPSSFSKTDVFALRTMFWWGNFISITLHLSGKYKTIFEKNIFATLPQNGFYICVNHEEWQHHFEESNYKLYNNLSSTEIVALQQKSFIKIALKYELHHWNMMQHLLPLGYSKICDILKL